MHSIRNNMMILNKTHKKTFFRFVFKKKKSFLDFQ